MLSPEELSRAFHCLFLSRFYSEREMFFTRIVQTLLDLKVQSTFFFHTSSIHIYFDPVRSTTCTALPSPAFVFRELRRESVDKRFANWARLHLIQIIPTRHGIFYWHFLSWERQIPFLVVVLFQFTSTQRSSRKLWPQLNFVWSHDDHCEKTRTTEGQSFRKSV